MEHHIYEMEPQTFPAIVALQNPSNGEREQTFTVFFDTVAGYRANALGPLKQQVKKDESHLYPEEMVHDYVTHITSEATFDDLGDFIEFARTEAVYVVTPDEVHLYAALSMDAQVLTPIAYGAEIDVHEPQTFEHPYDGTTEAEPIDTIDYNRLQRPSDELSELTKDILIEQANHIVGMGKVYLQNAEESRAFEEGQLKNERYHITMPRGQELVVRYNDLLQFNDHRESAGVLVRVPYSDSESHEEVCQRFAKIHWQINELRYRQSRKLWNLRNEESDLSEEEFQEMLFEKRNELSKEMVWATTAEFGTEIAPWSPQPYSNYFRRVTNTPMEAFKLNDVVKY
ncbi:hypothetical protein [Haloferax gibbonsii]|uniref:Uncharacterized protein n=1 Tax=Haloferax gibbonsii TaxID=35746 RepID=A0A0K1IZU1_HALGI|nr:hypothetical protein [Haloferax gibbonsii]AKU09815.1 hypothetical protein ABY42_18520 [Haloferax gibbonsii]